jgi:type VI secretion system protein ImpL
MESMLQSLLGRFAIVAAAISLLAVLIWYAGPLLAIAGYSPLISEWARIGLIAFIALIFGLIALWRWWRGNRAATALQKGLTSAEEGAKEAKVLGQRLTDALATLKRMGGKSRSGSYLYARPWYMIIGPPGTGKTTALVNSGLKFLISEGGAGQALQGVGGTRNCDWWFSDEAVLVDTAGRYTTQDSDAERDRKAWLSFLGLLRRHRPAQPLNGVMVAFGFDLLMNATADELKAHAAAVRSRLNELHEKLGVRLPVYMWLTKADILPGFVEFFDDLSADGRREVVGATWKWEGSEALKLDALLEEFDAALKSVAERSPDRLQGEMDAQRRSRVLGFPMQLAEARNRIATFFTAMLEERPLEPTPVFRGFYLTSGTQTGATIDRLLGVMSPARVAPQRRGKTGAGGRAYFLQRLLQDVMFPEAGLVASDPRARARRRWFLGAMLALLALVTVGLAGLWFVAYQHNDTEQERLAAAVNPFVEARAKSGVDLNRVTVDEKGLEAIVGSLDMLRALPGGFAESQAADTLPLNDLGLGQHKPLNASAVSAYRQGLYRMLLPRLILRAEDAVVAEQDGDWRRLYEALRVYLQIAGAPDGITASGMRDAAGVRDWFVRIWASSDFPGDEAKALRDRLTGHLDALFQDQPAMLDAVTKIQSQTVGDKRTGPAADWDLIKSAQELLANRSLEERALTAMEAEAAMKPEWVLKDKLLPGQERAFVTDAGTIRVPFLYTKQGYETVYIAFVNDIMARIRDEQWVLGEAGRQDAVQVQEPVLRRNLADTYAKAYVDRWIEVLRSVAPLGLRTVNDAVELTRKPQPISRFLGAVVTETNIVPPDQAKGTAEGQAGVAITQRFAELAFYILGSGETAGDVQRLEAALESMRKAMEAAGGGGGGGGGGSAAMQQASQQLAAAVQSMPSDAASIGAGLSESAGSTASTQARSELTAAYEREVLPACKAITKFYPFAAGQDAPISEFQRIFAPGGLISSFVDTRLGPYITRGATSWTPLHGDPVALSLSSRSIAALKPSDDIAKALFQSPYGVNALGFRVEVTLVALGPGVQSARFQIGGLQSFDYTAPGVPFTFEWIPGPGMDTSALTLTPTTTPAPDGTPPTAAPVAFNSQRGIWSFFRLLDLADCRPCSAKKRNYVFGKGPMSATFDIRLVGAGGGDPLDKGKLWKFRCPATL